MFYVLVIGWVFLKLGWGIIYSVYIVYYMLFCFCIWVCDKGLRVFFWELIIFDIWGLFFFYVFCFVREVYLVGGEKYCIFVFILDNKLIYG